MAPHTRFRFDLAYREEATLADGTRVVIRLVRPEDREVLRRGFARLSPDSRVLRFFTDKPELTDRDLARLTDLDGVERLALGAATRRTDGGDEGLGIARFARDPRDPTIAEAAVTVIDHAQRRGLGTLLLARLAEAAAERGIAAFSGEFLARNEPVRRLIQEACPDARLTPLGDTIRVVVPLPRAADAGAYRLFGHAARGRLLLRLRDLLTGGP